MAAINFPTPSPGLIYDAGAGGKFYWTGLYWQRFTFPVMQVNGELIVNTKLSLWDTVFGDARKYMLEVNSGGTLFVWSQEAAANVASLTKAGVFAASRFQSNESLLSPFIVSSTALVTNLNADLLDGFQSAQPATANTIALRDGGGHLYANHLHSTDGLQTGSLLYVMGKHNNGPDNFLRSYTAGAVVAFLQSADGAGSGLDADLVDGYHAAEAATGSTLVARNGSGYIFGTYLNQSSGNNENPVISQFIVQNGSDGYNRKASLAHVRSTVNPSGTWLPAATHVANVSGSTMYNCNYALVNGMVVFSGRLDVNATAAGAWKLLLTLPIASNFGALEDCGGTINQSGGNQHGSVLANVLNDQIEFTVNVPAGGNFAYSFSGMYRVI